LAVPLATDSKFLIGFHHPAKTARDSTTASIPPVQLKAESERALRFHLVSFVGDEAEKVNAAVFRAATGPVRDALKKLTQE